VQVSGASDTLGLNEVHVSVRDRIESILVYSSHLASHSINEFLYKWIEVGATAWRARPLNLDGGTLELERPTKYQ